MNSEPYELVIFDLDDTLLDTAASMRAGLEALLAHYRADWSLERTVQRHQELIRDIDPLVFAGTLNAQQARELRFSRLLTEWNTPSPDASEATCLYRQAYVTAYAGCEGALQTVQHLRTLGLKVAVLTNYLREVQVESAGRIGLLPLLDALYCVDDLPAPKPDPRAFLAVCQHFGVNRGRAVMVGDSLKNDVEGALGAGLHAVWFNRHGEAGPDVPSIRHLTELPERLTSLT